jgi:hypothetical protein
MPIPAIAQLALDVRGLSESVQVNSTQHIEVVASAGLPQQIELIVDDRSRDIKRTPPFTFDWDTSKESLGQHKVVLRGQDVTGAMTDKALTLQVIAPAPTPTVAPTPTTAPLEPVRDPNGGLIGAAVILVLLLACGGIYFMMRGVADSSPAPQAQAPVIPVGDDNTESLDLVPADDLTILSTRRHQQHLPRAKLQLPPDREIPISRSSPTIIGRDASSAAFVDDRQASRNHARITCADGEFWIEDLTSTNGTRINGVRIERQQKLANNDQIGVGDTILTFTLEPA